jgi:hypothetical protein
MLAFVRRDQRLVNEQTPKAERAFAWTESFPLAVQNYVDWFGIPAEPEYIWVKFLIFFSKVHLEFLQALASSGSIFLCDFG